MKYSKKKMDHHLELVYNEICINPSLGTRGLCNELRKQGIHLNRGYVAKLLWLALDRLIDQQIRINRKWVEFVEWRKGFVGLLQDIDELKDKMTVVIETYPGDFLT